MNIANSKYNKKPKQRGCCPGNHWISGFTLVELIITLAVAAILTTIALPSFRNLIANQRQSSYINEFSGTVNFARSEAIKRSIQVGVCSSTNLSTCSSSTSWANGWIAWIDSSPENGAFDVGEQLIRVGNKVEGVGVALTSSVHTIVYARSGLLLLTAPSSPTISFRFCDNRGTNFSAAVAVDGIGRPSVVRPSICP